MIYRPRTPTVEARQWTGENDADLIRWLDYGFAGWWGDGLLRINNRNGRVVANPNDWIVKEDGTFSVYEPELFHEAYEAAT